MPLFAVSGLPEEALAASAQFHERILPLVKAELGKKPDCLTLVFDPADHTHRGWRLAAVQGLAREFAPVRVNALVSQDEAAIGAASEYVAQASGLTGQVLPLDGNGAGEVLSMEK